MSVNKLKGFGAVVLQAAKTETEEIMGHSVVCVLVAQHSSCENTLMTEIHTHMFQYSLEMCYGANDVIHSPPASVHSASGQR